MMDRFLTKKSRLNELRTALEVVLMLAILVWTAAGVYVIIGEIHTGLRASRIIAFAIVLGLPLFVLLQILLTWRRRGLARQIAGALAHHQQDTVDWSGLQWNCPIANLEDTVEMLLDKGYLCNIATGGEGVNITRGAVPEWPGPHVPKCPACGGPMEKRISGDWACRRCGRVSE